MENKDVGFTTFLFAIFPTSLLYHLHEDNMLKITNDGRKLALDQRLINDMLPDDENSKASTCVEKARGKEETL